MYVEVIFLGRRLHQLKIAPVFINGFETVLPVETTLDSVLEISREGKAWLPCRCSFDY
jgi:hypothetical protein